MQYIAEVRDVRSQVLESAELVDVVSQAQLKSSHALDESQQLKLDTQYC